MVTGLFIIIVASLALPFAFHRLKKNIGPSLFAIGLAAAPVGGAFDGDMVRQTLV